MFNTYSLTLSSFAQYDSELGMWHFPVGTLFAAEDGKAYRAREPYLSLQGEGVQYFGVMDVDGSSAIADELPEDAKVIWAPAEAFAA